MTLCTPYSRVASRMILEVSLYLSVERTIAGVETEGMQGNVAPASASGRYNGSSVVSAPAAGTRASSA